MVARSGGMAGQRIMGEAARQWLALAVGLCGCFLVLLATKRFGAEVRVYCALGAMAVIGLWLAGGALRRDGLTCVASSTLALLPIAALECGWVQIEGQGAALLVETFCLAILFVGPLQRLGGDMIAATLRRPTGPSQSAP